MIKWKFTNKTSDYFSKILKITLKQLWGYFDPLEVLNSEKIIQMYAEYPVDGKERNELDGEPRNKQI